MIAIKGNTMNEILDLDAEEIEMISGAGEIDPPTAESTSDDYPIIINNPP